MGMVGFGKLGTRSVSPNLKPSVYDDIFFITRFVKL